MSWPRKIPHGKQLTEMQNKDLLNHLYPGRVIHDHNDVAWVYVGYRQKPIGTMAYYFCRVAGQVGILTYQASEPATLMNKFKDLIS